MTTAPRQHVFDAHYRAKTSTELIAARILGPALLDAWDRSASERLPAYRSDDMGRWVQAQLRRKARYLRVVAERLGVTPEDAFRAWWPRGLAFLAEIEAEE